MELRIFTEPSQSNPRPSNLCPPTHLVRALLHPHLALHLDHLLLLSVGQRPRHAQQQRAAAHDPQALGADAQARAEPRRHVAVRLGSEAALRGRDDVLQRGDALPQRLVLGREDRRHVAAGVRRRRRGVVPVVLAGVGAGLLGVELLVGDCGLINVSELSFPCRGACCYARG